MNKKYFAYMRESIDLKTGIKIQKEKIEKYCEYVGITIKKWFIDNDASAYKFRPNYEKMMKQLPKEKYRKVEGIICTHLFRFGRNTQEVLQEHDKVTKQFHKKIIFVEHQIDSGTTVGKAMLGMLAVFADFERETINERLLAGRNYAKIHGTKSGKPMHRPKKEVDWIEFDKNRKKGLSIPSIAKMIGMSKKTLYEHIRERE